MKPSLISVSVSGGSFTVQQALIKNSGEMRRNMGNKVLFCAECGAKIEDLDSQFCSECGSPLDLESDGQAEEQSMGQNKEAGSHSEAAAEQPKSKNLNGSQIFNPKTATPTQTPVSEIRAPGMQTQARKFTMRNLLLIVIAAGILLGGAIGVKSLFFKGSSIMQPVIFAGGKVFYINKNDSKIYLMNPDGSEKKKFDDTTAFTMAADGEWIYFSGIDLYKIKADGTGKTKIDTAWYEHMAVKDGWIYYVEEQTNNTNIFKRDTDGGNIKSLNKDFSSDIAVEGDYVYYRNVDDKHRLYRMKNDGSGRQKLSDDTMGTTGLVVKDGWIYYLNETDGSKIYKIKVDGSGRTKVGNDYASFIDVAGDWVYYANATDDWKLYKVKTDGTGRTKLNEFKSYYVRSNGDYVYFAESDHGDKLSVLKN